MLATSKAAVGLVSQARMVLSRCDPVPSLKRIRRDGLTPQIKGTKALFPGVYLIRWRVRTAKGQNGAMNVR